MLGKCDVFQNERGSVLAVVLLVLVLLTIIGIAATKTTTAELQIVGEEKAKRIAFYAAESGIEAGRAVLNSLKMDDSGNWDRLLAGTQFTWQSVNVQSVASGNPAGDMIIDGLIDDSAGGRNVGPASYTLRIRDNEDLDGYPTVDSDNIIVLIATGNYGNSQDQIETIVRYTGGGDQYAQEHYDTDSSGKAALESDATAGTIRW